MTRSVEEVSSVASTIIRLAADHADPAARRTSSRFMTSCLNDSSLAMVDGSCCRSRAKSSTNPISARRTACCLSTLICHVHSRSSR